MLLKIFIYSTCSLLKNKLIQLNHVCELKKTWILPNFISATARIEEAAIESILPSMKYEKCIFTELF